MIQQEDHQFSPKIIGKQNSQAFLDARMKQLQKIQSYHFYPIDKLTVGDYPTILYKHKHCPYTLAGIINNKIELLSTEIKSIIWQITKTMLECEKHEINHLRLQPKSIVMMKKYKADQPIFIQIKDFSLGKQFEDVSDGKKLDFFQFMHPSLSVQNKMFNFDVYKPEYDIWSLGVILYYLIYNVSPFCKQNKDKYSKTILRKYKAEQHEIAYYNNKYNSINLFISKCLRLDQHKDRFRNWADVKKWIINNQQLYNQIDFDYKYFEEMAQQHIRLMTLFSAIYCLVIEQSNDSPHPFWKKRISQEKQVPFQIQIAEFTLKLMRVMHDKFQSIYQGHYFLLPQPMCQVVQLVKKKIRVEEQYKGQNWLQPKFKGKGLNLQTIKMIQQICAKLKLELSDLHPQIGSPLNRRNTLTQRRIWKSMQILYDYCNEIICIFNGFKSRMKLIYEYFYRSKILLGLCQQGFHYQSILQE